MNTLVLHTARRRFDFRVTGGRLDLLGVVETCSQLGKRSVGQRGTGSAAIADACLKYTPVPRIYVLRPGQWLIILTQP